MKKNLTKKLMLSVLTLAFAVVSLGASTFAWFTTSETAEIEAYDAKVTGGQGIELAVGTIDNQLKDGTTDAYKSGYYVYQLPKTELVEVIETRHGFEQLENLSALKDGSETAFTADNLYDIEGNKVTSKDGFIAFNLYVKADVKGTITLNDIKLTSDDIAWDSGVKHQIGTQTVTKEVEGVEQEVEEPVYREVGVNNYNLLDALRVAVINNGTVYYYEEAAAGSNTQNFSLFGAYDIYNIKNAQNPAKKELLEVLPEWDSFQFSDETNNINKTIVNENVERDTDVVYSVYIWLEGYDAECVNALFASQFTLEFSFAFAPAA